MTRVCSVVQHQATSPSSRSLIAVWLSKPVRLSRTMKERSISDLPYAAGHRRNQMLRLYRFGKEIIPPQPHCKKLFVEIAFG